MIRLTDSEKKMLKLELELIDLSTRLCIVQATCDIKDETISWIDKDFTELNKLVDKYRPYYVEAMQKDEAENGDFYRDARKEMGLICDSLFIEFDNEGEER